MEDIINVIGMEKSILILAILSIILLIAFIITIFRISNINKKYKEFMKKLGNGKNLEEDLENYMYRVDRVEKQNAEINTLIQNIDKDLENCVQKVGIVRYSAFQDTGSDLSFTLALLDEKNTGVVLNGIYSREMSNIYAKPVQNGKSSYTLSEEEQKAIKKAMSV
jgi:hypothetical protein